MCRYEDSILDARGWRFRIQQSIHHSVKLISELHERREYSGENGQSGENGESGETGEWGE